MFKKFAKRFLESSIVVVIVTYLLLLIIFFPKSALYIEAQREARLALTANSVSPGVTIIVNGFEYPATEKVEIYFQDKANGVVRATTNVGGFFNVPLTLPKKYIDGTAYVYATSSGSTTKAWLKFVKPALVYTPAPKPIHIVAKNASFIASTRASFNGTGFIANEFVSFVLRSGNQIVKTGVQRADSQGHLALTLALPDMPFESQATLLVKNLAGKALASIDVRYSPRIQLSTFTGTIKDKLRIAGKGFKGGEKVSITFQGRVMTTVMADRHGNFIAQFNVPSWAGPSPYYNNVKAIGRESRASVSDSFQVLPSVSLNVSAGLPGQQVIVTGSQFTTNKLVQVLLFSPSQGVSSVGTPLKNAKVSSHGTFTERFTIPHDAQRKKVYSILYIDVASGLNVVTYFKVQ
jgi:hypothetical protein